MTVFCIAAISASVAVAASYEDAVIAHLRAQGYNKIVVETTLLGRVKISAVLKGGRREIILNPRTGEVLRDLWIGPDGEVSSPQIASANMGNPGGNGTIKDKGGEDETEDPDDSEDPDSEDDSDED